jgi:hypothetical protein
MMRMKEKNENPYFIDPLAKPYTPMFSADFIDQLAHIFLDE